MAAAAGCGASRRSYRFRSASARSSGECPGDCSNLKLGTCPTLIGPVGSPLLSSAGAAGPARGIEGDWPGGFLNTGSTPTFAIDMRQCHTPPFLPNHESACTTIACPQFDHGMGSGLAEVRELEVTGTAAPNPEAPTEDIHDVVGDPQSRVLAEAVLFGLFAMGRQVNGLVRDRAESTLRWHGRGRARLGLRSGRRHGARRGGRGPRGNRTTRHPCSEPDDQHPPR